jgi:hypothetical protein
MSRELELLAEIRDLLQVIAEPALARRDAALRSNLRSIVGNSTAGAKAVMLMDGVRTQAALVKESGINHGNLSRLVKKLATGKLLAADPKRPQLLFKIPSTFFDGDANE